MINQSTAKIYSVKITQNTIYREKMT